MPVHYNVPDTVLQALKEYDMIPALKELLGRSSYNQNGMCTFFGPEISVYTNGNFWCTRLGYETRWEMGECRLRRKLRKESAQKHQER